MSVSKKCIHFAVGRRYGIREQDPFC